MKRDVFISYSSMDKHVADAVCATLESGGVRCWIAPRDIFPGSDWAQSIISGIKSSRLMVLIFSHNSNGSPQVTKELNLAVSNNLMVVPFKIDDSVPSGSMEYFLADMHWLDAIDGDMQGQINKLQDIIKKVLAIPSADDDSKPIPDPKPAPEPSPKPNPAPQSKVSIIEAYKRLWTGFFDYKGCASRYEYWMATLANFVATFVVTMINAMVFQDSPIFFLLYFFASSIGFISLGVRRLHDTNRSGHWMWLILSLYGSVVLLVFFCFRTADENNRFKTKSN